MDMEDIPILLITANVGSLFELWSVIAQRWIDTISASVSRLAPAFLAFHFQEVGGKDPKISMKQIQLFSDIMLKLPALQMYKFAVGYLDTECEHKEQYTALGSFYFVHPRLHDRISVWDFRSKEYLTLDGRQVTLSHRGQDKRFEKVKFPPTFSPENCWCRKGFLHTRWRIDEHVVNFVNIHMFHDTSNLVALESSPSIYADCRRHALDFTLNHIQDFDSVPTFLFGDFNFRTDIRSAVKDLTKSLRAKSLIEDHLHYVSFADDLDRDVLLVGKKEFCHMDHEKVFTSEPHWLLKHDAELRSFTDRLSELDVQFPPSYPCQEESDVVRYLPTRCPAWCDRVLMNSEARALLSEGGRYDMIGKRMSMGDHKPVYLAFTLGTESESPIDIEEKNSIVCDSFTPPRLIPVRDRLVST